MPTLTLTAAGPPSCTSQNLETAGKSVGTDLTMQATVNVGTNTQYTTTTEDTSTFTWSTSMSVDAEFELASASISTTLSLEVTNTQGTQNSQTDSAQTTEQATWTNKDGQNCVVQQNQTDCTTHTTGSVDISLSGFIWMSYKTWFRDPGCVSALIQPGAACNGKGSAVDSCYDANSCPEHGHWGLLVEQYVPAMADRSNPVKFSNTLSTSTLSQYSAVCK
ncbi:hypothetical protein DFH06DRAFT_1427009 [Mycena polygramma]|nr:hypothetical protein DFH06DRAFT_1427009 [Mycena polygramma]